MVLLSYNVQTNNLSSYPTFLLQSLHHQSGRHSDISLCSGDQTVSVPLVLLRNSSPFLQSLLQSPCTCSQLTTVTLPPTTFSTLPSLVSLLYTGYISSMSRDQLEQLRLLTKELGLRTSTCDSNLIQYVSEGDTASVTGQIDADKDMSDERDMFNSNVDSDSYNHTMTGEDETRKVRSEDSWGRKSTQQVQVAGHGHSQDRFTDCVPMIPTVRPRAILINMYEEPRDCLSAVLMYREPRDCVRAVLMYEEPRDSVSAVLIYEEPEDSVLPEGTEEGASFTSGKIDIADEGMFKVETVGRNMLIIEHEDVGGELERKGDQHVEDCFSDIQVDNVQTAEFSQNSNVFICEVCDQTFKVEAKFRTHLASTHYKARHLQEDFKKFGEVCPFCDKMSGDVRANVKHVGDDHRKVNEYYEENFGDINFNSGRRYSKVASIDSGRDDMSSLKLRGNFQTFRLNETKATTSVYSPLKGILKLSQSKSEEKQPKSILRSTSTRSPPSCQSILKVPRSPRF
eukprot:GFUD01040071.1.p1 GENE.GFUD01040071.1~~GFUD01040071.1.p1  ORF type:complete len:511 (-),score=137.66 GFUD01040071.1:63-1595(-)